MLLNILDKENVYSEVKTKDILICIEEFSNDKTLISISKYINDHAEVLREKYLSFIDGLQFKKFGSTSIYNFLNLEHGFSFWLSGSLNQKSIYQHDYDECIKILAFEQILIEKKVTEIKISKNCSPKFIKTIKSLAKNLDIKLSFQRTYLIHMYFDHRQSLIFNLIKGLIAYINFFSRSYETSQKINPASDCIFIGPLSYLNTNLDSGKLKFQSQLWNGIDDLFSQKDHPNYLHIFSPYIEIPSTQKASNIIQALNQSNSSRHYLLDSNIGLRSKLKIFITWLKLIFRSLRNIDNSNLLQVENSGIDFSFILRGNLYDTILGRQLITNLFLFEYFQKKISLLKSIKNVFYLFENQAWEKILLYHAKELGNIRTFAVPHSTTRFWDLRHFISKEFSGSTLDLLPDYFLQNSPSGEKLYLESGYEASRVIQVEALRYNHKKGIDMQSSNPNILVLSDYSPILTETMLRFLERYDKYTDGRLKFVFKPHVSSPINLSKFRFKSAQIYKGDIYQALAEHNICICSNMTSAQVDAYCFGLKVLVLNLGDGLNMSPLMGNKDIKFISDFDELSLHSKLNYNQKKIAKRFFNQNVSLSNWKKVIDLDNHEL